MTDDYHRLKAELEEIRSRVYLYDLDKGEPIGFRTSFLKVPPEEEGAAREAFAREEPESDAITRMIAKTASPLYRKRVVFETIGYWDWVSLRYLSDFFEMTQPERPSKPIVLGQKSFYGIVLATNSGLANGKPEDVPFSGREDFRAPGVFAQYKLSPFLHFTGRKDLVVHIAQFLTLLIEGSSELWEGDAATFAWDKVLGRMGLTECAEAKLRWEIRQRIVPLARSLCQGIEFLVVLNLDWTDLSIYLVGGDQGELSQLSFFIREMPVLFPRFVSALKAHLTKELGTDCVPFGDVLKQERAKADEDLTAELVGRAKATYSGPKRKEWPGGSMHCLVPELPIFCGYVDVLTLANEEDESELLRFVQMLDIKATRVAQLLERIEDESREPQAKIHTISGPVDAARLAAGISDPTLSQDPELLHSRITVALAQIDDRILYRRVHARPSMFRAIANILDDRYSLEDWRKTEAILWSLGVSRVLIQSLKDLVLQHLSYRKQAIMTETLFDYDGLFTSLLRLLFDELVEEAKLSRGKYQLEGRIERQNLAENLAVFVGKLSQSLNARHHSTSLMFEVSDLNHNHKGGVAVFMGAYSELIHRVLGACHGIDRSSHQGLVKVAEHTNARVIPSFATVVEMDWLKLANPENGLVILHELGHALLHDKTGQVLRDMLDDPEVWRLITEARVRSPEVATWASFDKVRTLMEETFCDLFMLFVIVASHPMDERERLYRELPQFYDQFFFSQLEMRDGGMEAILWPFMEAQLVRWHLVRSIASQGERCFGAEDPPAWVSGLADDLGLIVDATRQRGEKQEELLARPGEEFLKFSAEQIEALASETEGFAEERYQIVLQEWDGKTLIPFPDPEEWVESVSDVAKRLSPSVDRVWRQSQESERCEHCELRGECLSGFCEVFAADTYCTLFCVLRPVDRKHNTVQRFAAFCVAYLRAMLTDGARGHLVDENGSRREVAKELAPVKEMYELARDLLAKSFDSSSAAEAYLRFDAAGNPVEDERYQGVVANPRGAMVVLDDELRLEFFGRKLKVLLDLADGRLRRIARGLRGDRVSEAASR